MNAANQSYYVSSCVFSTRFPELSRRIREYVETRQATPVRCCVAKYKVQEFADKMPDEPSREEWLALPNAGEYQDGNIFYFICHSCGIFIEEMHPNVVTKTLWELIDADPDFPYDRAARAWLEDTAQPALLQDCWRSRDRADEHTAVRNILRKLGVSFEEMPAHHAHADFCGRSLYRPSDKRNALLAPKHYGPEATVGRFPGISEEEQIRVMEDYCRPYAGRKIICYCHNCLDGLLAGGADARHLAEILFPG